ncbi:hypothetical protein A6A06_13105 [Streptomyces sp. CB02923]|nr:hypothetical protein A6A06_13105 [Streptomyces sp. CB02923]
MLLGGSGIAAAGSSDATASHPAAGSAALTDLQNHQPQSGKDLKAGPGTQDANGVWQVDSTTPTLSNTVIDSDGDPTRLTFLVYTADANGKPRNQVKLTDPKTGETAFHGVLESDFVAAGSTAKVTLYAGDLKANTTYVFRTSAFDGKLTEYEWSAWTKFKTPAAP